MIFGSTHIASSAYQNWPTKDSVSYQYVHLSNVLNLTHLKFESIPRVYDPQVIKSFLYRIKHLIRIFAILRETSDGTSY